MGVLSNNLPVGCENNPDAPWNQVDNPEREIEVTVSIILSKTVKVRVSDYEVQDDDIDYSCCDLKSAVKDQVYLPYEGGYYLSELCEKTGYDMEEKIEDLSNWDIDDFEVVL